MADVMTKEQRSRNMRNMKSKNTQIERILRKTLWEKGYRYRLNVSSLPGKPDIVLSKYKIAIFCDGEFFHGKDWGILSEKLKNSNNSEFWIDKISANMERDKKVNRLLQDAGWTVLRFWGREIKKNPQDCVKIIEEEIKKRENRS